MRRLRKLCAGVLCLCLLTMGLAGCKPKSGEGVSEALNAYATFYPVYAISSMIVENVPDLHLNCLVQPQDGCLRSYVLSDWDAALIASADAVIEGGRGLESFASALQTLGEADEFAVIEALYNIDLVEREAKNSDPDGESHWLGANPHIYMSIEGAVEIAGRIAQSMVLLDPRYERLYQENLERAEERLEALKKEVDAELAAFAGGKVAVLNEALVYVAEEYGLDIMLCWDRDSGESLDENALDALLKDLEEDEISVVLIEKQAPQSLLEALKRAGIAVATLDVLSTRRASEGYEGYFAAQRTNVAAVREAYLSISEEDK